MGRLVPSCVWRATPELVQRIDQRFGPPVDAYVNGSQVWLRDDGPAGATVEWRLHPVASFRRPAGAGTYDLFGSVAFAIAAGTELPAPLDQLWDGLEAFLAYGDETEPAVLAAACAEALGLEPDGRGLVDHDLIADEWERSERSTSIVRALWDQLNA